VVIRPSFTLGGSGGGIAYNREEMTDILSRAWTCPRARVPDRESVLDGRSMKLEVIRDLEG